MAISFKSRVRVWICSIFVALIVFSSVPSPVRADDGEAKEESVLTLDASNFDEVINKHPFVVVEFYAPWCGHCKDATANDVMKDFNVRGFPTLYFSSTGGKIVQYDGDRTKEDIIDFIKKNKDSTAQSETTIPSDTLKDEL